MSNYSNYKEAMGKIADLKYASAVLQWDQETYMPVKGAGFRGQQLATLAELAHEKFVSGETETLIQQAANSKDLDEDQQRNIELSAGDLSRSKKLPASFVRKMSEAVNKSFHAWIEARKHNNFSFFEQPLAEIISLKKQEAGYLGYDAHPYDALMDEYDKGLTVKKTDALFADLLPQLSQILEIVKKAPAVDDSFLRQFFDKDRQWEFGVRMLRQMNYDFGAGRQDISEHPFTTNFSSQDVRVTTRVDENDFANMLWSCLHEGGHALYEQGLPADQYGLPLGEYCSLSIHESQSRLWENCIGRSQSYWNHNYPILQEVFPRQLGTVPARDFYRGINKVQASLIRTEADELTYHMHVMIRYEIEKMLIAGEMKAQDIPPYWNELYLKHLGVNVPDDKRGCLQDIHWSHGSFGYFATYSIGSLYAAQFWQKIKQDIPHVDADLLAGNSSNIWGWLKQNVYPYGRKYSSEQLCEKITGSALQSKFFLDYAKEKYL